MHRSPKTLLVAALLLALASPWSSGCHLIFRYEDRPAEAGPPDARVDGPTKKPDGSRDGPRDHGLEIDKPLPDTRPPDTAVPQCIKGNPCDDGQPCTYNDKCENGTCVGTPYSCSDGLLCTTDICDNGTTAQARFKDPEDLVVDSAGGVYVADSGNNAIRMIKNNQVTTVAGGNGKGKLEGTGLKAKFNYPAGIAVLGTKTLYVADRFNHCIRMIELAP